MAKMNKKDFDDQVKVNQHLLELAVEREKIDLKEMNQIQKTFSLEQQRKANLLEVNELENKRNIRISEFQKLIDQVNNKEVTVSKRNIDTYQIYQNYV